ncbi:MAG TPA: DUF192 domain-containing protein, partial [Myxococcota bacterium]|nr:DUF192 domain-containing protein [Myxococcota bacterium]
AALAAAAAAALAAAAGGCDAGLKPAAATGGSAGVATGGAAGAPFASAPMVVFHVAGGREVRASMEVADTPAKRAKGLMDRTVLAPDAGMIFVFEREAMQSFWMKDTYIALDMVFVSGARKVVGVLRDVPPLTESSRAVKTPSRYVIELNAGFCAREGIVEGADVELVAIP